MKKKKSKNSSKSFVLQKQFGDFDDYADKMRSWNLRARQIGLGKFQGDLMQISNGSILITQSSFNRRVEWNGDLPPDAWTFGIPIKMDSPALVRGKEIFPGSMTVFSKNKEFFGVSPPGFKTILLSIPEKLLWEVCEILRLPDMENIINGAELISGPPVKTDVLRQTIQRISYHLALDPSKLSNPCLQQELASEIPQLLLQTLSSLQPVKKRPISALRSKALKKAETYIVEFGDEPPKIQDICKATGASLRTLQFAFVEKYGITPKTYLEFYRLNAVRKMLRKRDPSTTKIIDVANRWGFWHMGKFAGDYHKLFGELPSQTLGRILSHNNPGLVT